jgi:hypothetical protein
MDKDIVDWQWRNARLRGEIDHALENADPSVREEVGHIANELVPELDDPIDTLRWVNANLQRRAKAVEAALSAL